MSGNCTDHKTEHNVTTIANIPLVAWLICSIFTLAGAGYDEFTLWMSHPVNIVAAILFVILTLRHFALELEVVFEDYISCVCVRRFVIFSMKSFWFVLAITAIVSILKLALS